MKLCKILSIEKLNYNTFQIRIEKPKEFKFIPGHSVMVSVNKPGLESEKRPLTFTSTNDDSYIEFIVKTYLGGKFSEYIKNLKVEEHLILAENFGNHRYNKPGLFITGGAGIAPFIAIFRDLKKQNKLEGNFLLYSNKKEEEILFKEELISLLGNNVIFFLTQEKKENYNSRRISKEDIKNNFQKEMDVYICGSSNFVNDLNSIIKDLKQNI